MNRKLLGNPILHFISLGAIAFFAYQYILPEKKERLVITQQVVEALIESEENLSQQPMTEERKQSLIENYIDEEVMLQEAYKRNLHKTDFRVRKQLIILMRSSLTEVIPEPSTAQLRAFYDQNQEIYSRDPSWSFDVVLFNYSSNDIPKNPVEFINKLQNSNDPLSYSENNVYGNQSKESSFREIAMTHKREMAVDLSNAEIGLWYGPYNAVLGIEYFRVSEKHEGGIVPFETIESYLRDDYYLTKSRELQQQKINELAEKYEVVIE